MKYLHRSFIHTAIYRMLWMLFLFTTFVMASTKTWQYNSNAFIGWNNLTKKTVAVKDVFIQKKQWDKKEKRLSIVVKTRNKTYRDDFVFCFKKGSYYHCGIEDDGGYIKIDNHMNVQIDVSFLVSLESEPKLEFNIKQKQPNKWIHPITKNIINKDCSVFNNEADKKIFLKLLKCYSEFTISDIKPYRLGRYYDIEYDVGIIAPQALFGGFLSVLGMESFYCEEGR